MVYKEKVVAKVQAFSGNSLMVCMLWFRNCNDVTV